MQHGYMATVKKISRSVNYLPPMKGLTDWFNYAFKSSELDEVHRFPSISPSNEKEREISKVQQKTEEIFKLPCLRMDLKTKHVQVGSSPTSRPFLHYLLLVHNGKHKECNYWTTLPVIHTTVEAQPTLPRGKNRKKRKR